MKTCLITGACGFIGFHLSSVLLEQGYKVIGIDNLNSYYDVSLKQARLELLCSHERYKNYKCDVRDYDHFEKIVLQENPSFIVHLAAQAGVRYSLENPDTYVENNIIGTHNVLKVAKLGGIEHLLLASTSSVYGSNSEMPFNEQQKTDTQMSMYAATKKSCETLAQAYSHNFNIPITAFRFFTVYGPWGRPDMALFKFVKGICDDREIEVYNYGEMKRDFTYVSDLVEAVVRLIVIPPKKDKTSSLDELRNGSFRIVNIGNNEPVKLMDFVHLIEKCLNKKAKIKFVGMQAGDVTETWADISYLQSLIGYLPNTEVSVGVAKFVDWYTQFYEEADG